MEVLNAILEGCAMGIIRALSLAAIIGVLYLVYRIARAVFERCFRGAYFGCNPFRRMMNGLFNRYR